jgi:hypothetical protein
MWAEEDIVESSYEATTTEDISNWEDSACYSDLLSV